MSLLLGAFLGLFQGITEFLPVSSSGHLNLLQALFGLNTENQLLFNILLHVGTLIPVAIVFWKDWWDMLRHPIKNRTLLLLFVASLPALAAKLLFGDQIDYLETHNILLGVCFLFTGLLLLLTQRKLVRTEKLEQETAGEVSFFHALCMGGMQAIGILPGVSRSGSTIFGGVISGLNREKAAKFSFMMSAPAIVAGLLSEGYDAIKGGTVFAAADIPAIALGVVIAAVSGYFAIRFMLRLIAKASLNWFALYVTVLGIVVIVLQVTGVLVDVPADVPEVIVQNARLLVPVG